MNPIETHQLSHRYSRTEALHDLSFDVPAGSVCALLGPNGAGKTTTVKLLMNLLRPGSGSATVLGVDARRLSPRELAQIGYVSENQQLPVWMTVRQLLAFCRPFYPTWDVALEKKLLVQFDLPAERKLKQLSRGQLMKAALLSSLAYRPKLLVLDEPFSGLDPVARDDFVRGLLEAAGDDGWTVLVSSHDIEEVERLADRLVLLDRGRLQLAEPVDSLLRRFRRVELAFAADGADIVPEPGWLQPERLGGRWRFVAEQFDPATTEDRWRRNWPAATEIIVQPMTLREIFIALARRPGRPAAEGLQ